jgi:hypothetical protein
MEITLRAVWKPSKTPVRRGNGNEHEKGRKKGCFATPSISSENTSETLIITRHYAWLDPHSLAARICTDRTRNNPESTVGVLSMAGTGSVNKSSECIVFDTGHFLS